MRRREFGWRIQRLIIGTDGTETMPTDRRNKNAPVSKTARVSRKSNARVDVCTEEADERVEEAENMAKISADKASALQSKLTEQIAFTAARDAKLATLEAQLNSAKKATAEAMASRESSDGDSSGASGAGQAKYFRQDVRLTSPFTSRQSSAKSSSSTKTRCMLYRK